MANEKVTDKIEIPLKMTQEELNEVFTFMKDVNFKVKIKAAMTVPYDSLLLTCLLYTDKPTAIDFINEVIRSVDALLALADKLLPILDEATKNAVN